MRFKLRHSLRSLCLDIGDAQNSDVITLPPRRAETRPSTGKAAEREDPEAYFLLYVEGFERSRTQLETIFTILPICGAP